MSQHSEQEIQQTLTPTEVRQQLLSIIETNRQALQELSDEELAAVAGGGFFSSYKQGSTIAAISGGNTIAQIKTGLHTWFNGGSNESIWNYTQKQVNNHARRG
jgi:hypothetical protein